MGDIPWVGLIILDGMVPSWELCKAYAVFFSSSSSAKSR